MVIIYIDDLISLASHMTKMEWLKSKLNKEFDKSDVGELYYCLGVEFERDRVKRTRTMSQRKYIEWLFKRFHIDSANPLEPDLM